MTHRFILFLILGIDVLMLLSQISHLSISYDEANLLYGDISVLGLIVKSSLSLFGQNDFALRLPMILMHLMSAVLLYIISKEYIPNIRNRIWLVLIFVLLPGVMSSAIVVNSAGLVIFGLLLFIYVYQNLSLKYIYFYLSVLSLVDPDFIYLFLSLAIYSIHSKDKKFFVLNTTLLFVSSYIYGLEEYGMPSGHFLDTMAIYAAVLSPIVFIYIFYVLYRKFLLKEIDVLWFIASVPLLFSLMLSFRQHIAIEHFAPYIIMGLPIAAKTFYSSYRIRLKIFRHNYRNIFTASLLLLVINSFVVLFNKEIYIFIQNPQKHFAYKMHVAKELADKLKKDGISCVKSSEKMSKRLRFYHITSCDKYLLEEETLESTQKNNVTIGYKNRIVYRANVTNVNNR